MELPISWTTALAIYFIAWWIVLFAVLPFGVRSQEEHGAIAPGTDPGAPVIPLLIKKAIWTTIVTSILCGFFFWLFLTRRVTLDDLATLWGLLPQQR
jgi:predicted secreted protein